MNRRQGFVSGALLAFLLAAPAAAQQPDCSQGAPPTGSIQVTGPQVRVGERLFAGPGVRVEVAGTPAQWTLLMDKSEASAWPDTWTAGDHTAGAAGVDSCGRRADLAPIAFTMDTEGPAIRWQTGNRETFEDRLAPDSEKERRRRARTRYEGQPAKCTWITIAGVLQTPLPWVDFPSKTFHARGGYRVQVKSDHPQAFLEAPGTVAAVDGSDSTLGERLLWITAEDAGAGVESMTLCLHEEGKDCPRLPEEGKDCPAPGTAMAANSLPMAANNLLLRVKAIDNVGNESTKEIVLRRGGQTASR